MVVGSNPAEGAHFLGEQRVKITIEFEVDRFEWEGFEVGLPVTLDELTEAAGCDLDAVVVKIDGSLDTSRRIS